MRKIMVAGNWKMHGTSTQVQALISAISIGATELDQVDWLVLPPFVYLQQVIQAASASPVSVGAQTLATQTEPGAFTGEISAGMLKDIGCQTVLVGHSERRQLYGETDDVVAAKFKAALAADLHPILCVGETLPQRDQRQTEQVVQQQLLAVIETVGIKAFTQAMIAYEPVWAIGTGKSATAEQAQAVHQAIRALVAARDEGLAKNLRILYGGSVNRDNANALFAMADIDGGLVGGASLDADHFLAIGRAGV